MTSQRKKDRAVALSKLAVLPCVMDTGVCISCNHCAPKTGVSIFALLCEPLRKTSDPIPSKPIYVNSPLVQLSDMINKTKNIPSAVGFKPSPPQDRLLLDLISKGDNREAPLTSNLIDNARTACAEAYTRVMEDPSKAKMFVPAILDLLTRASEFKLGTVNIAIEALDKIWSKCGYRNLDINDQKAICTTLFNFNRTQLTGRATFINQTKSFALEVLGRISRPVILVQPDY